MFEPEVILVGSVHKNNCFTKKNKKTKSDSAQM